MCVCVCRGWGSKQRERERDRKEKDSNTHIAIGMEENKKERGHILLRKTKGFLKIKTIRYASYLSKSKKYI